MNAKEIMFVTACGLVTVGLVVFFPSQKFSVIKPGLIMLPENDAAKSPQQHEH